MDIPAPTLSKDVGRRLGPSTKLDLFFASYPLKRFDKGQIFLFPDDRVDYVFYVIKGFVRVYDISSRGNEVVVNVFPKRSIFPMSKVLNKTHNHYFYQANSKLEIREAPPEDFMEFLRQNNDVVIDLLAQAYMAAQDVRRRMAHLMGGSASNRLLYELIIQAHDYGKPDDQNAYLISLNESEIGARSGLSRETVSREMRKLKRMQLITVGQNGVKINNVKVLEAMLGSNL
jgi:CRP-like cAMP-binding protein